MSVYIIVLSVDYEGDVIFGVHRDREEAERECERLNRGHGKYSSERYEVQEWEVC